MIWYNNDSVKIQQNEKCKINPVTSTNFFSIPHLIQMKKYIMLWYTNNIWFTQRICVVYFRQGGPICVPEVISSAGVGRCKHCWLEYPLEEHLYMHKTLLPTLTTYHLKGKLQGLIDTLRVRANSLLRFPCNSVWRVDDVWLVL